MKERVILVLPDGRMYNTTVIEPHSGHGYMPGHYSDRICASCKGKFVGDKHAWKCEPCATKEASGHAGS